MAPVTSNTVLFFLVSHSHHDTKKFLPSKIADVVLLWDSSWKKDEAVSLTLKKTQMARCGESDQIEISL